MQKKIYYFNENKQNETHSGIVELFEEKSLILKAKKKKKSILLIKQPIQHYTLEGVMKTLGSDQKALIK